jgi:complex iron-sulfur molybdoenzyme family reductase subunit alpha
LEKIEGGVVSDRLTLSRRQFLKVSGLTALALSLDVLQFQVGAEPLTIADYRSWEDLYRKRWTWDKIARSTHSANCTGSCSWKVFVKDGIIWREEQAADYPAIAPDLPDVNPRGCNKGACYVEYVHGEQRVKYPLKRLGKRGEGKWQRISWDQALHEIADKTLEILQQHGPDYLTFFSPIPAMSPVSYAAGSRLANLLGGVVCSFYDWYCDLPPGEPITWGEQTDSCESADWWHAKYIIFWGSNPNVTRIPDAHYFWESKYNGTKIVSVSPDYNQSSLHADMWVGPKPGTDAALALALANVIVNEKLYDADYVKEQTDLPLLVRRDSGKFLRESDLVANGKDDRFYIWDEATNQIQLAPGGEADEDKTLALGVLKPALEGTFTVQGLSGKLELTTVFELLKETLQRHTPETMSQACGVHGSVIEKVAREFAEAKPAMIVHGAGTNHWYHNDLSNRAMILLVALTGNVGRRGGGFNHYVGQEKVWPINGWKKLAFPRPQKRMQPMTLWSYVHGEIDDHLQGTPYDPRPYIKETVQKGWMPLYPRGQNGNLTSDPKALIIWRGNYLNQAKGNEQLIEKLWPKLELIVDINFRMDTSALYSDYVLPAATFYEKYDLNTSDLHTFIHPFTPVVEPMFWAKTDWQVFYALASALEKRAKARGFTKFHDEYLKVDVDLSTLASQFTDGGKFAQDKAACEFILADSEETQGIHFDDLIQRPRRFVAASAHWTSDLEPGKTYAPFLRNTEKKKPYNTLTGRQQFYIDHDWFAKLGEALPVYKPPLEIEKYPLRWNTPHGRWSIHSTWRDNKYMLRLDRGGPVIYLNPEDAKERGIADGDTVRVFNDFGDLTANVRVYHNAPRGQVTMYHGWEKYQFPDRSNFQATVPIRIKPTQLVGGYGQLHFELNYWGPTGVNRDVRVDVQKVG